MKKSRLFKILTPIIAVTLVFTSFFTVSSAYAKENSSPISPAIDNLAQNTVFTKNGMRGSRVEFCADEFEECVGCSRLASITILVLPDSAEGKLMLGNVPVLANQIIPRNKLSKLSFVPSSSSVNESSFVFGCISSGYPRVIGCSVKFTETLNFAPNASSSVISAYAGVDRIDFLPASDPDGDEMTFSIISRPSNGKITLVDEYSGKFIYSPTENAVGEDSFSYTVSDCYGNTSGVITVSLDVKKAPKLNYVDVDSDFEYNALLLADKGIYVGKTVGKYSYFEPSESLSYDEFAIMAIAAAGLTLPENDSDVIAVFGEISDAESDILTSAKALEMASYICKETVSVSGISDGELTRIDAAKILLEILK
ncbi:MAG: hypothetical protein E7633_08165 [Ruminococcaceae bacterium]|nr:hypothetical protein [Oscillospiraceae bacterium]